MAKNQSRKPGRDIGGGKGKTQSNNYGKQQRQQGSKDRAAGRFQKDTQGNKRAGQGKGYSYKKDRQSGADIIAGKHAVIEAIEAQVPIKNVMVAQGIIQSEALDKIMKLAERMGIDVDMVPRARIEGVAGGLNHQGIIAMACTYEYATVGSIMQQCEDSKAALVLVLDHITDVGNFGAIVRTAEVVGASGVIIPNKRSVDVVSSCYKTSAGAVSRMNIAKVSNIATTCDRLRDNGFWIAGASEKTEQDCWDSPLNGKIALVMGSEGEGLSKLVQQKCDFMVKLPQRGQIGSLNVSCAAAALSYEWLRQSTAAGMLEQ